MRNTPSADNDDPALARAFAAHERWAFDEAYRRHASLLFSTAFNVLHDDEDARDAVHDALTRVWRSPDAYSRSRGTMRSFLTVCVRNEAITRLRSRKRHLRLARRIAAQPIEYDELRVSDSIEHARLHAAMRTLPIEQLRPLELAYFEHLTHSEIARALDQPLGTVKSRIATGLRKLSAALHAP